MTLWLNQRLLVSMGGPTGESLLKLDQPFLRVGSDPTADVVLEGDGISRRSAYLHGTPFGIYAIILQGEKQGPYPPEYWLSPGRSVQVGQHRLTATLEEPLPGPLPNIGLITWGSISVPRPVVDIYHAKKRLGKRHFSASLSLIGRKYQCALQLKGQNVSEFHCAMYWQDGRLWCIDLNSSNGTLLNGRRVIADEINIGDEVEVGDFNLVFRRLSYRASRSTEVAVPASPGDAGSSVTLTDTLLSEPTIVEPLTSITQSLPADNESCNDQADLPSSPNSTESEVIAGSTPLTEQREQLQAQWREAFQKLADEQEQLRAEVERLATERRALELEREEFQRKAIERLERPPLANETPTAAQPSITEKTPDILENASEPALPGDSYLPPAAISELQAAATQDLILTTSDASAATLVDASPPQKNTSVKRINRDELASMVLDRLEGPKPSLWRWLLFSGLLLLTIIATLAIAWLVYKNMNQFSGK